MKSKVQGEGDYESARRYNRHLRESVHNGMFPPNPDADRDKKSLQQAEQAGRSRSKAGNQDEKDAELMSGKLSKSHKTQNKQDRG
ncbi:MAG: hypothetical protein AB7T07_14855 [Steroidobacteraceae bacterium]